MFVSGIDIGSLYTKAVVMHCNSRNATPEVVASCIMRSGAYYKKAAGEALERVLKLAHVSREDIHYIISTGYGRYQVGFGDGEVSEISCHARGAGFLCPEVRTVIDIGGQDSRVIIINQQGGVVNFIMNDKCAAGTGRFLEVMAQALECDLDKMGELALSAKREVNISSTCTVFAESEVISLFAEGYDKADIAAGIYQAIAWRMRGMAARFGPIRERVMMSGGVGKSIGMRKALEKVMGTTLVVPEEPQIIGALGAGLIAASRASQKPD